MRRLTSIAALALGTVVLASSCSTAPAPQAEGTPSGAAAGQPVSIDNCGVSETFAATPSRVVLLGFVSVAEVSAFVELGIQDSIIANLQTYGVSDDPALVDEIAALPSGGLSLNENFGPPAEQVLALQPDLVVSTTPVGFDANLGFATRSELADAGANTYVTPARCADGNPDATAEELDRYDNAGIDASYELIEQLGEIFHVEDRAADVVSHMTSSISATEDAVAGEPAIRGIVVSPGAMHGMGDAPLVWTGGIVDDVLERAGVANVFADAGTLGGLNITAEQLAAADPQIIITFTDASVDLDTFVDDLAAAYPQWDAVQSGTVANVYDGLYLGTTNDEAIAKIAKAAHPGAF